MSDAMMPASGDSLSCASVPLDPRSLHLALNQASYDWCLESDSLVWSAGAAEILGVRDREAISSGRAFARLLDVEAPGGRREAIVRGEAKDGVDGAAYCLRYACRPGGNGRRRWIEDRGRWFAGPEGRPVRASGLLRIVADCEDDTPGGNRQGAGALLDETLAKAAGSGRPLALFLISIDRLGSIGAMHGAGAADTLAAQVMRGLRAVLRVGDHLVSIADGRFAVIVSGCPARALRDAARRFHRVASRASLETQAGTVQASVSIGGVGIGPGGEDAGSALHAAQRALERCEREEAGGFVVCAGHEPAQAIVTGEQDIADALNEERLFLAFDPVVDVNQPGQAVFRARAFIRTPNADTPWYTAWLKPDLDAALARRCTARLLDLAEEVLDRHPAVQLILPLPTRPVSPMPAGGNWQRLTIEIEEALARADLDRQGGWCRAIKALGARLGISGFGAGHLSFAALGRLQADCVTLKGALVETASQVAQGRFALRCLVEAATAHRIAVGAEWVDDAAMAELLAGWGCARLEGAVAGRMRLDLPRPRHPARPQAMTGTR